MTVADLLSDKDGALVRVVITGVLSNDGEDVHVRDPRTGAEVFLPNSAEHMITSATVLSRQEATR